MLDAADEYGATLLYVAAAHGHKAMAELLVDEGGADMGNNNNVEVRIRSNCFVHLFFVVISP